MEPAANLVPFILQLILTEYTHRAPCMGLIKLHTSINRKR